jgi:FtsH-binding integral membrane protein
MKLDRASALATNGLAAGTFLFAVVSIGAPDGGAMAWALSRVPAPVADWLASVPLLVVLPLLLAIVVVARAVVTRSPGDVVLAAFATPCLLVTGVSLYGYYFTNPGVYFGGFLSLFVGSLLAVVVGIDLAVTRLNLHTT